MRFIVESLRKTYHTERKAYPALDDLINMLEYWVEDEIEWRIDDAEYIETLRCINELLYDINLPIPNNTSPFIAGEMRRVFNAR